MRPSFLPVSVVVLAGGQARRMDNADKGLLPLHGKPLVQWVLERIAPQADEILISANRNLDDYRRFGHRVIVDAPGPSLGPLAGLLQGLRAARHDLLACVPCDSPLLPGNLIERLHAALLADVADLAVAHAGGRPQPVFCLCRKDLLPQLENYLAGGGRRADAWYAGLKVAGAEFEEAMLSNVNTPEDLERLVRAS
ncbi:MAG: molybdenum cofactor guanylyltransferase MobA [Pseudomonadota bacterium]